MNFVRYKSYKVRSFIPSRCTVGFSKSSNNEIIKPFSLQSFLVFIYLISVLCDNTWLEPKYTVLIESSWVRCQCKIGFACRILVDKGNFHSFLLAKAADTARVLSSFRH